MLPSVNYSQDRLLYNATCYNNSLTLYCDTRLQTANNRELVSQLPYSGGISHVEVLGIFINQSDVDACSC